MPNPLEPGFSAAEYMRQRNIRTVDIETTNVLKPSPTTVGLSEIGYRTESGIYGRHTDILQDVLGAETGGEAFGVATTGTRAHPVAWGADIGAPGTVLHTGFQSHMKAALSGKKLGTEKGEFLKMMGSFGPDQKFGAYNVGFEFEYFTNLAERTGLQKEWGAFAAKHELVEESLPMLRWINKEIVAGRATPFFGGGTAKGKAIAAAMAKTDIPSPLEPHSLLQSAARTSEQIAMLAPEAERAGIRERLFGRMTNPYAPENPAQLAKMGAMMPKRMAGQDWLTLRQTMVQEALFDPGSKDVLQRIKDPLLQMARGNRAMDIESLLTASEISSIGLEQKMDAEIIRRTGMWNVTKEQLMRGSDRFFPLAEAPITYRYMSGWSSEVARRTFPDVWNEVESGAAHTARADVAFQEEMFARFDDISHLEGEAYEEMFKKRLGKSTAEALSDWEAAATLHAKEKVRSLAGGTDPADARAYLDQTWHANKRAHQSAKLLVEDVGGEAIQKTKKIFKETGREMSALFSKLPTSVKWGAGIVAGIFALDSLRPDKDVRNKANIQRGEYDDLVGMTPPPQYDAMSDIGDYGRIARKIFYTPNGGLTNRTLWENRCRSKIRNAAGANNKHLYSVEYSTNAAYQGMLAGAGSGKQARVSTNASRAMV